MMFSLEESTRIKTEKNNFLFEKILIGYDNKKVKIDVYDTPLGKRFIEALKDNLRHKRILEKNLELIMLKRQELNLMS